MPVSQAGVRRRPWTRRPPIRAGEGRRGRSGGPSFGCAGDFLGGATMPMYLTRFRYTPETWAMMIADPEDRRTAAQAYIESVGGRMHGFWYAFGEHDGRGSRDAPNTVSMADGARAMGGG